MNKKQLRRAKAKYDAGLHKKILNADFNQWDSILEDAKHHILKLEKAQ